MIMERKRRLLFLEAHLVFFFLKGIVIVLNFVLTAPSRRKLCSLFILLNPAAIPHAPNELQFLNGKIFGAEGYLNKVGS
jgi:hypothetical protein